MQIRASIEAGKEMESKQKFLLLTIYVRMDGKPCTFHIYFYAFQFPINA